MLRTMLIVCKALKVKFTEPKFLDHHFTVMPIIR